MSESIVRKGELTILGKTLSVAAMAGSFAAAMGVAAFVSPDDRFAAERVAREAVKDAAYRKAEVAELHRRLQVFARLEKRDDRP